MKFCEDCGAQLDDDALFCEECGWKTEPPVPEVPVKAETTGNIQYLIILIVLYLLAGSAGFLLGYYMNDGRKADTVIQGDSKVPVVTESAIVPTIPPTLTKAAEETTKPTVTVSPDILKKPTEKPEPTVSPTPIEKPEPTASPTPTPVPVSRSVFDGFVLGECSAANWRLETPDGLVVNISNDPMAPIGIISFQNQRFEFGIDSLYIGDADEPLIYTYLGTEGYSNPQAGYYDELQIGFTDEYVTIYWSYHAGQRIEVIYENVVSTAYASCKGTYVSYGRQAVEMTETGIEKCESDNLFERVTDGEQVQAEIYADTQEDISISLSYNDMIDVSFIDLYLYDEFLYVSGLTYQDIRFDTDEVIYLVPQSWEGDMLGPPDKDLSEYDRYYVEKLHLSDDGLRLYWSFCESGIERVLYEGHIDVEWMERIVTITHY